MSQMKNKPREPRDFGSTGAFTFYCNIYNYFCQDFSDIALALGLSRAPNALRATGKAFHSKALPQPSAHDLRLSPLVYL